MGSQEEILYREIWRQKVDREHDLAADGDLRTVAALQMIDRGNRLLDVGCGEGTLAYRLRGQFREVHGIDISKEAIRFAREKGIEGRVLNINEKPLPYPDRTFDTVTSLDVIEHVFDPIRFVKEIHRVLTPGGHAVLSTPNIRKIQRIASLIAGHFPRTSYDPVGYDGGHLHYFTSRDMKNLMEQHGFAVTRIDGICGDRRTWKYRLAVFLLGQKFEKEFLSSGILIKARRL